MSYDKVDYSTFEDVSLKEFLSRPLKVATLTWAPGSSLNTTISLPTYLGLTPIKHKLNQFARIRFSQVITVSVAVNPFYAGSLLLSALPLAGYDQLEPGRIPFTPVNQDFVRLTQRPNVFMSVNQSQSMTLKLPYFNVSKWYTLNQTETALNTNFYGIYLNSINNLSHCNGSSDSVTVQIFMSLEDVELEVPTTYYAASGEQKAVSKQLEKLAHATKQLAKIPIAAPYATPMSMALKVGADLAKTLGYSRPFLAEDRIVKTHDSMSNTDQPIPIPYMGLSSANSVALGAELNLPPEFREMDIVELCKRYSYLSTITWNVASAVDTSLLQFGVTPCVYRLNGTEQHYPATGYCSLPFTYWSGTLKYKIQAIASQMHRGRLRITWDPYPTADINTPGFYSTPVTVILDLEKESEVELEVPFHSQYSSLYCPAMSFPVALGANLLTCNGYVTISVMNLLNTPNGTIDTPVEVNIWIAGGDSLRFYRPGDGISTCSFYAASGKVGSDSKIETSLVNHGEAVTNIRALVKRESPTYVYTGYGVATTIPQMMSIYEFDRPVFRGTKTAGRARSTTTGPGAISFDYGMNNLITHFEGCFAARKGSYVIRYTRLVAGSNRPNLTLLADHDFVSSLGIDTPGVRFSSYNSGAVSLPAYFANNLGGANAMEMDTVFENVAGRKPYYNINEFLPNRYGMTNWGTGTYTSLNGPSHVAHVMHDQGGTTYPIPVLRTVSAGEDYSLFCYIGPPIVYVFGSPGAGA
ncbi:hypothetical protein 2 [Hubei picorna-like virus 6]|uniref:hypothetical protein 2 n=1 Tax=Hubei picorna-like virus 6 TaxID=1923142 RepID=UPI00090B457B|nr:hypothetical protein 2 [Hubei picorna-like virus 6]APG78395.1 hypothetical protein 2 [Hubei picorna-like virus 6]